MTIAYAFQWSGSESDRHTNTSVRECVAVNAIIVPTLGDEWRGLPLDFHMEQRLFREADKQSRCHPFGSLNHWSSRITTTTRTDVPRPTEIELGMDSLTLYWYISLL